MAPPSILYHNSAKTVVLLDLPRSIEEAQILSSQLHHGNDGENNNKTTLRALISAPPPTAPFALPEPKSGAPSASSPAAQVAELMTLAAVESALDDIATSYDGPWYLPRHHASSTSSPSAPPTLASTDKDSDMIPRTQHNHENDYCPDKADKTKPTSSHDVKPIPTNITKPTSDCQNDKQPSPTNIQTRTLDNYHIPPLSRYLHGTISATLPAFQSFVPPLTFDLIVLDPPWPNRSAKRKRGANSYDLAPDLTSTQSLLASIPVASCLSPSGLVAVWVTNRPSLVQLLTEVIFEQHWHLELVAEWTWLKVTAEGEPVSSPESAWRKPWEKLLVARPRRRALGAGPSRDGGGDGGVKEKAKAVMAIPNKVMVTVPDVHSRKPNLRGLFEEFLGTDYSGLEVFARNLTAGWWGWGNQVLHFQAKECWVERGENKKGSAETADLD